MCPSLVNANEKSNGMMRIIRRPLFTTTQRHEFGIFVSRKVIIWIYKKCKRSTNKTITSFKKSRFILIFRFHGADDASRETRDNEQVQCERFQFYFHLTPHTQRRTFFVRVSRAVVAHLMMSPLFQVQFADYFQSDNDNPRTAAVATNNQMCESLRGKNETKNSQF